MCSFGVVALAGLVLDDVAVAAAVQALRPVLRRHSRAVLGIGAGS